MINDENTNQFKDSVSKPIIIDVTEVAQKMDVKMARATDVLFDTELVCKQGVFGVIDKTSYADLVFVNGNPLENVALIDSEGANSV
ncbi:hypothetical protein G8770_11555 [Aestuariicella hydrocarbonica]|uniref:Uncharacterized protein n=1 Tax=Pseudomaricurvus hydrocarbonicus TaxID=1470433 RepID=A0A9E5JX84_9GAMM|nr:hypothetical protein [Aestuariicella hydrocarbonica]NHO66180.1 hypothetical protein [Aestuariicella hydrocarbonica]